MADASAAPAAANGATAPAAPASKKPSVADWSKSKLLRVLRLGNMCNGMGLITTGILIFLVNALTISFTSVSHHHQRAPAPTTARAWRAAPSAGHRLHAGRLCARAAFLCDAPSVCARRAGSAASPLPRPHPAPPHPPTALALPPARRSSCRRSWCSLAC